MLKAQLSPACNATTVTIGSSSGYSRDLTIMVTIGELSDAQISTVATILADEILSVEADIQPSFQKSNVEKGKA